MVMPRPARGNSHHPAPVMPAQAGISHHPASVMPRPVRGISNANMIAGLAWRSIG